MSSPEGRETPSASPGSDGVDPAIARRRKQSFIAYLVLAGTLVVAATAGAIPDSGTLRVLLFAGVVAAGITIAAWAEDKLAQLVLLAVTLALCLVMAEFVLRQTVYKTTEHDDLFQYDEKLGWRFIPGKSGWVISPDYRKYVTVNSAGYHDVDPASAGPAPAHRIAVLGDSFTSNLGVDLEETFTRVLDRRLGPDVEVRNLGINGFGQVQELLLLDEILADDPPDLVLVLVYARNDLDDNSGRFDWMRRYERPKARIVGDGRIEIVSDFDPPEVAEARPMSFYEWLRSTALDRLIRGALGSVEPKSVDPGWVPQDFRYARVPLDPEDEASLTLTIALLDEMQRQVEAAGKRFGVIVAPSRIRVLEPVWQRIVDRYAGPEDVLDVDQMYDRLAAAGRAGGRAQLDLREAMLAAASGDTLLYYPEEQHWTAEGNAAAAEAMARWIEEDGLLR